MAVTGKRGANRHGNGHDAIKSKQSLTVAQINALTSDAFVRQYVPTDSFDFACNTKIGIRHGFAGDHTPLTQPNAITHLEIESCLDQVHTTSGDDYHKSSKGWNAKRKLREMRDPDLRYLLVSQTPVPPATATGTPSTDSGETPAKTPTFAGFLSFMITYEDGSPVLYIYEIHLDTSVRGNGLGRHLMDIVETIAVNTHMTKLMLTVFRSNDAAIKWYHGLGFGVDEYSPPEKKLRNGTIKRADYLILSKPVAA